MSEVHKTPHRSPRKSILNQILGPIRSCRSPEVADHIEAHDGFVNAHSLA